MNKINVLIIEDNQRDAENTRALLLDRTEVAYNVVVVESRAQALELLKADGFDAILLDLVLQNGAGLSLVRDIIAAAGPNVGLVVLTGYGEMEQPVLAAGADQFAAKPADPSEISRKLQYSIFQKKLAGKTQALEETLAQIGMMIGGSV